MSERTPRRIFEAPAAGPSTIKAEGETSESKDAQARRTIIQLLEKKDEATLKRFQKSGKTEEEFIADHVKYFGRYGAANILRAGMNEILGRRK